MPRWLLTPPGRYLLEWERQAIDAAVADVFGFHALQLGLPEFDALRANRMPHRWLAQPHAPAADAPLPPTAPVESPAEGEAPRGTALYCDLDALPFASQSLDLVVLPHALEFAGDPHRTLREVERVLVPEGRVVVVGFNPNSLWGLRQLLGRAGQRLRMQSDRDAGQLFLPRAGDFIAHRRLADWLRLLGFELNDSRFGCYRPALKSEAWLERCAWMEAAGERSWPVFGAVYLVQAVKRVRGMRLIGLARNKTAKPRAAPAVVSHKHRELEDVV